MSASTESGAVAVDSVELLRRIVEHVAPEMVLKEWTADAWTGDRQDDDRTVYYRVKSTGTSDDEVTTASFDLAGPRIEPKVTAIVSRSPLLRFSTHDEGNVQQEAVGPDGPPLHGEAFSLLTWSMRWSSAHPARWSVTLTGRLGAPEPEPFIPQEWPAGFVPAW